MNIKIRPLIEQDAYTSYKWRNDKDVFKFTGNVYSHDITLELELDWIRKVITNKDDYRCAIIVDDIYVGNIYLTNIHDEDAEYHIFIGEKKFWGKGIAYLASLLIIEHAFIELKLKKIHLEVRKKNTSALNLYEKLGFVVCSENDTFIYLGKNNDRNE